MITHVVCWKLKESLSTDEKQVAALEIKTRIEGLKSSIADIHHIEIGLPINPDDSEFDVLLYSTFVSLDSLVRYQHHPLHEEVAQYVARVTQHRMAFDYQTP